MRRLRQRIESGIARRALALSSERKVRLSGRPPIQMDGRTLDPDVQLILALRRLRSGPHGFQNDDVSRAREDYHRETMAFSSGEPEMLKTTELHVDGAAGSLQARHYVPSTTDGAPPLLVFFHGGGFVVGDLDTHDDPCRILAHHGRVQVLSVAYRLAPEHPFPASVLDALAALAWAQTHAEELGVDPGRIGVGGDSAGGNLAAVVSWLTVRDAVPPPDYQCLIYPLTDVAEPHASRRTHDSGFVLTREDMDFAERHYVGSVPDAVDDPRYVILRAPNLGGLCPALVVTAGFDPLRDEGNAYARALQQAGNSVDHLELEGFVHGFLHMSGISGSVRRATEHIAERLASLAHG